MHQEEPCCVDCTCKGQSLKFGQLELATIPGIHGAEWLIQEVIHEHWRWSSHKTLMDAEEVTQESPLCGKILCEWSYTLWMCMAPWLWINLFFMVKTTLSYEYDIGQVVCNQTVWPIYCSCEWIAYYLFPKTDFEVYSLCLLMMWKLQSLG
jgi:hypothetical protein